MSNTTERPAEPADPADAAPGAEPVVAPVVAPRCPGGKGVAELVRLRPTQLTLGYIHVHHKMEVTQRHADPEDREALQRFMRRHRIKTVAGPGGELYIVDHHHWARAWLDLGYQLAPVRVLADFSDLDGAAFWKRMRELGHVHPYDEHGKRQGPRALPSTVRGMRDDPYRSLAAFAREAGAYRKPGNAYGDFCWAGFLRKRVAQDLHSIAGFGLALAESIKLARSPRARRLPGFCGGPLEGKTGKPAKPLKTGKGKNGRAG
ncbi:MAG: hypothetical protein HOQ37_00875 [Cupriavidus sp.]|nr:hypothetical protein [Cupriavidus sp.]